MAEETNFKLTIAVVFGIALLIIAAVIGFLLVQNVSSIYEEVETSGTLSETYAPVTSLTNYITPTGEGITSSEVKAYNQTWLNFDGVNDRVVTSLKPISFNETGFSFSIWVKNNDNICLEGEDFISSSYDFRIYVGSSTCLVRMGSSNLTDGYKQSPYNSSYNISNPVWNHFVFTWDNSTNISMFFQNNFNPYNFTLEGLYSYDYGNLSLGDRGGSPNPFKGSMDELRIYNQSLTQSQITEIYNSGRQANSSLPSDGLVLWYSFDEASGTTVYDKSGNGNNGV